MQITHQPPWLHGVKRDFIMHRQTAVRDLISSNQDVPFSWLDFSHQVAVGR
ncbi:MAG: hypothetical protein ACD_34C00192G0001 [uncultured bacterium]|nr:MAG: hypothetical protein ACD_34C00192G0001 [uncultured bacterium]